MDQNAPASRTPFARLALIWGIGGFALTAALVGGMSLNAQGIARHDSNAPVTYDAGKFVLNDNVWTSDPRNQDTQPDDMGGVNSVLRVTVLDLPQAVPAVDTARVR